MWLTRLALRNPILILMMTLMVLTLGFVALDRLSVDLFPNISIPVIRVATFYPGAGPSDIEEAVTKPLERAVSASPGIDRVESTSKQGASVVSVWFNYDTDIDNAQFEVSQRVSQVLNTLPPGIQQPFVLKFDITNIPVVQVAVNSEDLDERQIYDLAFNTIEPQIERIPGVASAAVGGGKVREIEVRAQRDALRARKLDLLDVVNAVKTSNLLLPSGKLRTGDRDYNVFANTQVDEARPLREIVLRPGSSISAGASTSGAAASPPVRLGDVAEVEDGTAEQTDIVRINGKRGVYIRILKQPGANTIAVVDAVRAALPSMRGVPANVKLAISFDQSTYIRAAIRSLEHEAVQGGLLAIAVILFFLLSLRATGIVALAIPLSIVATFMLLYFSGQTLNIFTLGGLALGVGRLVDDSIVELENIHRHLEMGNSRKQAVLAAAEEVAMPILVSTITTIVVFFPVLFLTGVARNLFLPLALTISFALMMSFFVSRTVTPLLCLRMLRGNPVGAPRGGIASAIPRSIARLLTRLDDAYARAIRWVLHHRLAVVSVILGLFGASLLLGRSIGTEFFPAADESQFTVNYKTPIGTRVERTEDVAAKIEQAVMQTLAPGKDKGGGDRPLFTTLISDSGLPAGRTALFTPNTGPHAGNLQVNLISKNDRKLRDTEATELVRSALRDALPGVQVTYFNGGIVKRILNFGSPAPIDIEILGQDLDVGSTFAKQVLARMRSMNDVDGRPLLTDLQLSREENYPELDVDVDRQKAGLLGLSEQQVAQNVLTALVGNTQFSPIPFTDARTGNVYFVNIKLDEPFRSKIQDLHEIFMRTPSGAMVSLDTVATIKRSSGPVLINRKYLQRVIDVTANVAPGKDLGTASATASRVLAELTPPEGVSVRLGGQSDEQKRVFSGLTFAAVMAIALVYMVLASQFKSLLDPLVIMFSVPLGISGVFVMLWATNTTLSVNSFMGIIMMVGIVVSNGVLLVDFANVLRGRGKSLEEATIEACRTRLRPILMTTIATIVGLIPMALGIGEGSETNLPLARAVIGGLAVSTFFTLFLVPSLYTALDRFAKRKPGRDEDEDEAGRAAQAAP
jgi:hydrophobe/amphiphile efflux-1 (HAE1) family protein